MSTWLEYARPTPRRPKRLLRIAANVSLCYPVFFAMMMYGEWIVAWFVLGHSPRLSLDDPKSIPVTSAMHVVTWTLLLGAPLGVVAGVALNLAHVVIDEMSEDRTFVRLMALGGIWVGLLMFLGVGPVGVFEWWLD